MPTERRTNNFRSFASPGKYIQGEGVLDIIQNFTDIYGKGVVFIVDSKLIDSMKKRLSALYSSTHQISFYPYEGEITLASLDAFEKSLAQVPADVYVGVGGGKTIDTTKVIAERFSKPVIIVPTVASTDAPTSGLSVIYKESGEHSHSIWLKKAPDLVLVDSAIIAKAPVRFLVSGMGDALATYFEAMANIRSYHVNILSSEVGYNLGSSLAAEEIAKLCHKVLMANGRKALHAAKLGIVSPALESVIEANTLLSGLGFESNGTAAAHAIGDGLTAIPVNHISYHGERVAFGVLCEMMLENTDDETVDEVYRFCVDVGLPVTLAQLGVDPVTDEKISTIADVAMHNVINAEPMIVTKEMVISAILTADSLGKSYLEGKRLL